MIKCPELTLSQEAALNSNHQFFTTTTLTNDDDNDINDLDHYQRNLLHLVVANNTWSVGRTDRNEKINMIRTLLSIDPQLVIMVDNKNHTPLYTALEHGAVDCAIEMLHTILKESTMVEEWLQTHFKKTLPLFCLHGMLVEKKEKRRGDGGDGGDEGDGGDGGDGGDEGNKTIVHYLSVWLDSVRRKEQKALLQECLRSTIRGLGCRASDSISDVPWMNTLHV